MMYNKRENLESLKKCWFLSILDRNDGNNMWSREVTSEEVVFIKLQENISI